MILAGLILAMTSSTKDFPIGSIKPYRWEAAIPVSGTGKMSAVDDAVKERMRRYGIVGCGIAIVKGSEVIYAKGFGYSELPGKPFLPTTASRCGSVAKPITALCALLLVDQGKLDLDEKVVPILAEAGIHPVPTGRRKVDERIHRIRVRDLMDHTSGLPGWTTYTAWRPNIDVIREMKLDRVPTGADVAAHALGNTKLSSDPGTKMEYANANFVMLARVIEARAKMPFNDFLTKVAMPKFGVDADEIFVSRNQLSPEDPARGKTEAAYYQTSAERYGSFVPADQNKGTVFAEAYRGYATEASDGAGGIAATALGVARILANLSSSLSSKSLQEIAGTSSGYRIGFNVRLVDGRMYLSHGGMTNHCGGAIGHHRGYQFVIVSNWNNAQAPFVDSILSEAVGEAISKLD